MINFLKDEHGAWLRKCCKFVLVSSLLVVIVLFSRVKQLVEKNLNGKSCKYAAAEACKTNTLA